jgi:DNA-binding NarL/FixJ family response regulator/signal transduction histidine kinase
MSIIAFTDAGDFRREALAWASIGLAGAWTAWLTVAAPRWDRATLGLDLAICSWLVVASGLVVFEGEIVSGRAFFATGYPLSAALSWGVRHGPKGGLAAGGVLGLALVVTRPLNGASLGDLPGNELRDLIGGVINYLVAGGAVGFVSMLLVRSGDALQRATDELVGERERAARFAERESLARQIHDSVLQALALIHKRGRELSRMDPVPGAGVAELGRIAEKQEEELRSLILREPETTPAGRASLRSELEAAARALEGIDVSVSCVGPIWLERRVADELSAAVRQALANVIEHAGASRAAVFAEQDRGRILVTVRDDGKGFEYDEVALRANGKGGHPEEHEREGRGSWWIDGGDELHRTGNRGRVPGSSQAGRNMSDPIRVMVVDDHPVWRDGVRSDLESAGHTVVGEAADGREAIALARDCMPEVILMDLQLPHVAGVEATRRIIEESPHVKVLVLSASAEEKDVFEAVKAGAAGYLLKSSTSDELVAAIARVRDGEPVFTASLAGLVLDEFRRIATRSAGEPELTPRENEVLVYVAKGYTYKEIGEKLYISTKTVQNHVQNILTKLQLRKRYELMRYALQRGLDQIPE